MIVEIKVPSPGESITEVEIETWLVENGTYVEMDAELAEISSDKATLTINAEQAGVVEILAEEGDTVAVNQVIAKIDTEAEGAPAQAAEAEKTDAAPKEAASQPAVPEQADGYAKGVPSPAAAKAMAEKGIAASELSGTGRGGRITKSDVLTHKPAAPKEAAPKEAAPKEARPLPELPVLGNGQAREERREKMSTLRRKIAQRLVSVKNDTAMLTTFNEVDMKAIMDLRKQYKEKFKETHGVGLGFMSFFGKACSMALMEFPAVNARIEEKDIVYNNFVDMGIAVSSERGLVVPVIRNSHLMGFDQFEQAVLHYALKAG